MLTEPVATQNGDPHKLSLRLNQKLLTAMVHVPENPSPTCPPLLALHGISRNAATISAGFAPACLARGQVLIVPRFSRKHWPHFQQIGQVRADKALLELLRMVEILGLANTSRVSLFGYSGGAQLAHRFAMLYPNRIDTLHLAAAGWYCLPDTSLPFPMGLGLEFNENLQVQTKQGARCKKTARDHRMASMARAQLATFLKLPMRVYVGEKDENRDPALRTSPLLDLAQGKTRRARARTYAQCVASAAHNAGIAPDIVLSEIPDCTHSFSQCAAAGMTQLVCH